MAATREDNVRIDIESLACSIEEEMSSHKYMSRKCCIFKTPAILSRCNEKAYIPNAFSIGPLHHGQPNLKATEKIKANYLRSLIDRLRFREMTLVDIIDSIEKIEGDVRQYYAEPIGCSTEEFVKILVIDGCFIIELFRKFSYKELREKDDSIFSMSCMFEFLYHDLVLLENQVPWIVLDRLFTMTWDSTHEKSLIQLAEEFFENIFSFLPPMLHPIKEIKHIVDLLRKWLVSPTAEEEGTYSWELMPSAASLVEAGIQFRRGTSKSILDITFNDGVLEIPPLLIQETTETVIRNLISFEQCYPNCKPRLTSYAILLDNLINNAKDMEILCKNQIFDKWLNPEDAVSLFNKLYHNTGIKEYYYESLCKQVNGYCQRRWPRWRAVLMQKYFNTPWSVLSTLAVIILLVLSFLQTFYTIRK